MHAPTPLTCPCGATVSRISAISEGWRTVPPVKCYVCRVGCGVCEGEGRVRWTYPSGHTVSVECSGCGGSGVLQGAKQ